jgi:hypothetical protein
MMTAITLNYGTHINAGREPRADTDHNRRVSEFCSAILFSHRSVDKYSGLENFSYGSIRIDKDWYLALLPNWISLIARDSPNSLDSFDSLSALVHGLGKRDVTPHRCRRGNLGDGHPHMTAMQSVRDASGHFATTANEYRQLRNRQCHDGAATTNDSKAIKVMKSFVDGAVNRRWARVDGEHSSRELPLLCHVGGERAKTERFRSRLAAAEKVDTLYLTNIRET